MSTQNQSRMFALPGLIGRTLCYLSLAAQPVLSRQVNVTVTNPGSFDRPLETIELSREALRFLPADTPFVLEKGRETVSQLIDLDGDGSWDQLVFQSSFGKNERKHFTVRKRMRNSTLTQSQDVASSKYILPRKDIAWENDRIAHRIYGSILAGNVLDGIDVWVKRVRYPIIDEWYNGDSLPGVKRISYHVDHGEGADMFDVGSSLGDGGCAIWSGGNLIRNRFFSSYRIVASGPVRTMFAVMYDSTNLNGHRISETRMFTLDAGSNLNRIEVTYGGLRAGDPATIAAGLVKRENTAPDADTSAGWLSLWGPVDNDSSHGSLGLGVVFLPGSFDRFLETPEHVLFVGKMSDEMRFAYYTGAGWTKSGDFPDRESWIAYLGQWEKRISQPLKIEITASAK
ncbi:MAG TPA: DUF4861 domain-containing protein [Bacteroidota bacterium]|nr:DUF4861 domain-containing protein [Bacteroidota bacterium]